LSEKLEGEVPYFLEWTWNIVSQIISWDIDIDEMLRQVEYIYDVVDRESREIDAAYEKWDYGRPGIMDGGPNYVNLFSQERDKCVEILRWFNIS